MKFSEQLSVPVPISEVWQFLGQAEQVAACLPGCVRVQELEPNTKYLARFEDHIGPYRVTFDLDIVVRERQPERRIRLFATGQDKLIGLSQKVDLAVDLRVEGSNTVLDVAADVEVLGKAAALGQFAIKRKARDVIKQLGENLEAALQGRHPSA